MHSLNARKVQSADSMHKILDLNHLSVYVIFAAPIAALGLEPTAVDRYGWDAMLALNQPWRYLTCHFVHLNAAHAIANLAALALLVLALGWLHADPGPSGSGNARTIGVVEMTLGAWVMVSIGLASGIWDVEWYAGLSGMLYGLYAGCAVLLGMYGGRFRIVGLFLLLAGAAKIALDLRAGVGAVGALGVPVAAPAHLHGFLGGILGVAARDTWRRTRAQ